MLCAYCNAIWQFIARHVGTRFIASAGVGVRFCQCCCPYKICQQSHELLSLSMAINCVCRSRAIATWAGVCCDIMRSLEGKVPHAIRF